ncbi:hypothetical protein LZ30DRAFT_554109, partial [Colletotrichum cereale]
SAFGCTESQISTIKRDLQRMHEFAAAASTFLKEPDSHTTAAFIAWFGEKNSKEGRANAIRQKVYDRIYGLGNSIQGTAPGLNTGGDRKVVLGCATRKTEQQCNSNTFALSYSAGNYAMLCPNYFRVDATYENAFAAWRDRRDYRHLGAETLLHEMTHLDKVVGEVWMTSDLAYGPKSCMGLADKDKIENADNFAFFAYEIMANPTRARKQVDMKSSGAKRRIAEQLL